ncbi:hypothetical protein [Rheinheimera sp.]|uniref:hypothetical protein n=1 Tax=Rheinheimera sp. TaxID=1869214 RepID=UPI00404831E9
MNRVLVCVLFCFFSVKAETNLVLDIPALAGKTQSEVASIIGEPISCEQYKGNREACHYKKAETEITYINNKADWF